MKTKISSTLTTDEPTTTLPAIPQKDSSDKYYVSIGYMKDPRPNQSQGWVLAQVAIAKGKNQTEATNNILYVRAGNDLAARMLGKPKVPPTIYAKAMELLESINRAAERAERSPIPEDKIDMALEIMSLPQKDSISDQEAIAIVMSVHSSHLRATESPMSTLLEALFEIHVSEVSEGLNKIALLPLGQLELIAGSRPDRESWVEYFKKQPEFASLPPLPNATDQQAWLNWLDNLTPPQKDLWVKLTQRIKEERLLEKMEAKVEKASPGVPAGESQAIAQYANEFIKQKNLSREDALKQATTFVSMDPSSEKKYLPWLFNHVEKLVDRAGRKQEPEQVRKVLENFEKIRGGQFSGFEKEIDRYQSYGELADIVDDVIRNPDNYFRRDEGNRATGKGRYYAEAVEVFGPQAATWSEKQIENELENNRTNIQKIAPNLELVYDKDNLKIYKFPEKGDPKELATAIRSAGFWGICTREYGGAKHYLGYGDFFVMFKDNKAYRALSSSGEMRDKNDKIVLPQESDTGLYKILAKEKILSEEVVTKCLMYIAQHLNTPTDQGGLADKDKAAFQQFCDTEEAKLRARFGNPKVPNKIPGGLAKGKSTSDFLAKWKIPEKDFKAKLAAGIKIEREHTSDATVSKEIAYDHLWEDINYYEKLSKIEKK